MTAKRRLKCASELCFSAHILSLQENLQTADQKPEHGTEPGDGSELALDDTDDHFLDVHDRHLVNLALDGGGYDTRSSQAGYDLAAIAFEAF
jgi:hypothetical protein